MMYYLNKIIWGIVNPAVVGCLLLLAPLFINRFRRVGLIVGFIWLYLWMLPAFTRIVGVPLERGYLIDNKYPIVEAYPVCDAIIDMGGGMWGNPDIFDHAVLNASADRAYLSALLWKAGKAPIVIPSGIGVENSDKVFLTDHGVPENKIFVENYARNTEENARFVRDLIVDKIGIDGRRPKVLVVSSAWHMQRVELMFEKYAPELDVIPVACDFECVPDSAFSLSELIPNPDVFARNSVYLHEWLGLAWYKFFRR